QSFAITVRGVNVPPLISSTPPTKATIGQAYTYAVQASDVNGDPLAFTLATAPAGMTIDATSGLIQWTPDATQVGARIVEIRVEDGQGGAAGQTYTVVVSQPAQNAPPVISSRPSMR